MGKSLLMRDMSEQDLPVLFEYQREPAARHMAAFTPKDWDDRSGYLARWKKYIASDATTTKTLVLGGRVIGMIAGFEREGQPEVTYWLGQAYWGRGLATRALARFLSLVKARPLYARASKDNVASIRVLEKCGFVPAGREQGFANARGEEVEEVIYRLD